MSDHSALAGGVVAGALDGFRRHTDRVQLVAVVDERHGMHGSERLLRATRQLLSFEGHDLAQHTSMVTFDVQRDEQARHAEVAVPCGADAFGELDHVGDEGTAPARVSRQQLTEDHRVVHRHCVVEVGLAHGERAGRLECRDPRGTSRHECRETERAERCDPSRSSVLTGRCSREHNRPFAAAIPPSRSQSSHVRIRESRLSSSAASAGSTLSSASPAAIASHAGRLSVIAQSARARSR